MATWTAQGYVFDTAGSPLVGKTVNAYPISTVDGSKGALAATTTTAAATAGPPERGAGFWALSGLDDAREYIIEIIYSASQKLVRTRFSAEMGYLMVKNEARLPTSTYINNTLISSIYAPIASPTFTGTVTAPNVSVSGVLTVTTTATLPSATTIAGTNIDTRYVNATGDTMSGALTISSGGAAITGATSVTGAISASTTVTAGTGLVATTGGLTVSAGGASITGAISASTTVTAGTGLTVTTGGASITGHLTHINGDFTTYRAGGTTGVVFLNAAQNKYLHNDGSNYQLPLQGLIVGGTLTAVAGAFSGAINTTGLTSSGNVIALGQVAGGSLYTNGGTGLIIGSGGMDVTGTSVLRSGATIIGNVGVTGQVTASTLVGASTHMAVGAGAANYGGEASGMIFISNRGGGAAGNPIGGGWLYVEGGALKYKGSSGSATNVAPA